jgi:hypothetical protein
MRFQHAIVALLFSLACAERIAIPNGLYIRQDNTNDATVSERPSRTAEPSNDRSTLTQSASRTSSNDNSRTSTASDEEDAKSPITISRTESATPTMEPSSTPTAANGTAENQLPITPRITPGLGVGGAILMIAGLALGFVGIKHRATQTFLSTALVTALGVVVLIVYLMNPPVTDAIEGAFLIAGVLGGCLLGGLALIFKEVSEGFGCILGGFSLAMWLLVLVPGGTIKNQAGRIILISILCVGCFCSYVSRFTRIYGMIFCTAFAGATAFVLGIDCFSKAGLKEFWIYIWSEFTCDTQHISHKLTCLRRQRRHLPAFHRHLPDHEEYASRDRRNYHHRIFWNHVADQDLEDRQGDQGEKRCREDGL